MIEGRKRAIQYIKKRIKLWERVLKTEIYKGLISKKEIKDYIKYSKDEIKNIKKEIELIKGEKK